MSGVGVEALSALIARAYQAGYRQAVDDHTGGPTLHHLDDVAAELSVDLDEPDFTEAQIDAATKAAIAEARWTWAEAPGIVSPYEAMRPIVEAVLAAAADQSANTTTTGDAP